VYLSERCPGVASAIGSFEHSDTQRHTYNCVLRWCTLRFAGMEHQGQGCEQRFISAGYEVPSNAQIPKLCCNIVDSLELTGSINDRLRLTAGGPIGIEIDPRVYGTVLSEHKVGFKDDKCPLLAAVKNRVPTYETRIKEVLRMGTDAWQI
jgi:hypothetical protein